MQKIMSLDMVAHSWANKLQASAKTRNGKLFFDGDAIYSYDKYFCIAQHTSDGVLFTTRTYNAATDRHINIVRNSVNHLKLIYCLDPSEEIPVLSDNVIKVKQSKESIKKFKADLIKWRSGKTTRILDRINDRDFLRANILKKRIETSQGIPIPIETAKRAYHFVMRLLKSNQTKCNFKILKFEIEEVNRYYIKAMCHKIDIKEINKLAKSLNW
jgi:hypothetical protein